MHHRFGNGYNYRTYGEVSSSPIELDLLSSVKHPVVVECEHVPWFPVGDGTMMMCACYKREGIQWNFQTRETMGPTILSLAEKPSLSLRSLAWG